MPKATCSRRVRRAPTIATPKAVYSVDNLNHFADVLNDIDELAKLQLIPPMARWRKPRRASLKSTFTIPITCWTPAMMRWR